MREREPFLFDPDSDIPVSMPAQKLKDEMVASMADAGIAPRLIWIYVKTELIRPSTIST